MGNLTVLDIVKKYLKNNGYDGLVGDECGCKLDKALAEYVHEMSLDEIKQALDVGCFSEWNNSDLIDLVAAAAQRESQEEISEMRKRLKFEREQKEMRHKAYMEVKEESERLKGDNKLFIDWTIDGCPPVDCPANHENPSYQLTCPNCWRKYLTDTADKKEKMRKGMLQGAGK